MKIIRWGGLGAFVVILIVLVGGVVLFAEPLLKSVLQSTLSGLNKAQVDIGEVEISYSPLEIKVINLKATDPDQPMFNMTDIAHVKVTLHAGDLFFSKLNIDDMSVSGVKFNTPRSRSGKIEDIITESSEEDANSTFSLPDISLPDIDDVLAKETLSSEKLIAALNTDLQNTQKNWQDISADINNQQRWDSYDARYNKILKDYKGNFKQKLEAAVEAKKLIKSLKSEVSGIKKAKSTFNTDLKRINKAFTAVKDSPSEDIKRIKEKYKLDQLDAGNITELLFGTKTAEWVRLAKKWVVQVQPYLEGESGEVEGQVQPERGEGIDVTFKEYQPKPAFYIRKTSIDAQTERGRFSGLVSELSSDQTINKQPIKFKFSGVDLKHSDKEELSGQINYVDKTNGFSEFNYSVDKYHLDDYKISDSESLPLKIKNSLLDIKLNIGYQQAALKGKSRFDFNSVDFSLSETGAGTKKPFSDMLSSSLENVDAFYLNIDFKGSMDKPAFNISSDLDNRIGKQFKRNLNVRVKEFESGLKDKINIKIQQPLSELEDKRKQLDAVQSEIDSREAEINQKISALKKF